MRVLKLSGALLLLALWMASGAQAHPLGNFSINHLDQVRISSGRVAVRYILDQAEIPTFQERGLSNAQVLASKQAEVAQRLSLTVDGRRITLAVQPGALFSHPPGQGGLLLTRVELFLSAAIPTRGTLALSDQTFPGRVGWKAVVAQPGQGTAVRSTAPTGDPTGGLRSYPTNLLTSPLDQRTATFTVAPGGGTLQAPRGLGGPQTTTTNRSGDGFAAVFGDAAAGKGVLLLLLLASFGWGAVHALSPGHGKGMVAAYLVGSRGTPRHAVLLGLTVTVTHTLGVFALGAVTLLLSQYVLPDQLYPWLNLASGLLIVTIGGSALRSRVRARQRAKRAQADPHSHDGHEHSHAAEHGHATASGDLVHANAGGTGTRDGGKHAAVASLASVRESASLATSHSHLHGDDPHARAHDHDGGSAHSHSHGGHSHSHGGHSHSHEPPQHITPRSLIAMGASAGLIPCPSALVVLLGAIAQHQLVLGLILIVAFSVGLAFTLSVLGLLVVWMGSLSSRINFSSPLVAALPAISALLIVAVGLVLTGQAIPKLP